MKRVILAIVALASITFGAFALVPNTALAASGASKDQVCSGIGGCNDSTNNITNTIRNAINLFSAIVGIIAVIVILVAGFQYVTAAGDSSKVSNAKTTLIYAIVGLIVAALSQAIVQFVLKKTS
jgi:hypothetical protein